MESEGQTKGGRRKGGGAEKDGERGRLERDEERQTGGKSGRERERIPSACNRTNYSLPSRPCLFAPAKCL